MDFVRSHENTPVMMIQHSRHKEVMLPRDRTSLVTSFSDCQLMFSLNYVDFVIWIFFPAPVVMKNLSLLFKSSFCVM